MAFLVSVALFGYAWLIGFAVLGVLYRRDDLIRTVLIAPAVGIVTLLYCTYVFSRLGLPIGSFARALGIALLAAAIAALVWRRPPLPGRRGLPYLLVLALAFAASGWPLLVDGFAWVAHLNPDAGNYMLDTDRLVRRPYLGAPDVEAWRSQTDWASLYVVFPLTGIRTGTDLIFAWVVSVSGLDEPAAYMPLIVALHVSALSAATALIRTVHRFARLLSGALLAVAALSSVGVTLQLLGQELGLTCLALASVLLLSPFYRLAGPALVRFVVLATLVMAGFLLSYPEMLPFLGMGFLIYHGVAVTELRPYWRRGVGAGAIIGIAALVLIAPDALASLKFLLGQLSAAESQMRLPELFPFFLIPSGVAALWGLRPYAPGGVPILGENLAIALGFALSAAASVGTLWMVYRREACAAMVVLMVVLGAALAVNESGFGIFKLAMYVQPFLMMTAVLSLCRLLRVAR
jgi:hypothetical protein